MPRPTLKHAKAGRKLKQVKVKVTVQAYSVYMHSEAVHISKCSKQGRLTAPDAKGPTVGTRSTGEEHIPSTSLKKGAHASPKRARPSKAAATEAFSLLLTHRHNSFARPFSKKSKE